MDTKNPKNFNIEIHESLHSALTNIENMVNKDSLVSVLAATKNNVPGTYQTNDIKTEFGDISAKLIVRSNLTYEVTVEFKLNDYWKRYSHELIEPALCVLQCYQNDANHTTKEFVEFMKKKKEMFGTPSSQSINEDGHFPIVDGRIVQDNCSTYLRLFKKDDCLALFLPEYESSSGKLKIIAGSDTGFPRAFKESSDIINGIQPLVEMLEFAVNSFYENLSEKPALQKYYLVFRRENQFSW